MRGPGASPLRAGARTTSKSNSHLPAYSCVHLLLTGVRRFRPCRRRPSTLTLLLFIFAVNDMTARGRMAIVAREVLFNLGAASAQDEFCSRPPLLLLTIRR